MSEVRAGVWFLGIGAWIFGISDRTFSAFTDGYVSAGDLILLSTALLMFVGWLFLIPDRRA